MINDNAVVTTRSNIVPFALRHRWIVTVESERLLVKVRHRTRWYVVSRRVGHEERSHWCASRADALGIAEYVREAHRAMEELEYLEWLFDRATETQRAKMLAFLETCKAESDPPPKTRPELFLIWSRDNARS
jgi:DNA-binding FadR family transcriptional regulator